MSMKAIFVLCAILILAAWFYRPGTPVNLGPGKGRYIVTEKGSSKFEHWIHLQDVTAGMEWGKVRVLKEEWDAVLVGSGFGGNIFRIGR